MANRDAKLIERTLKDFSLGAMSGDGGQGGGSLYTYYIKAEDTAGNHFNFNCTIQCESSDINSYDTLAEYLIEKGFYPQGENPYNPDFVPLLNVSPEGGGEIVTGLFAIKGREGQDDYYLYANTVYISSGELGRGSRAINPKTFSITLITKQL